MTLRLPPLSRRSQRHLPFFVLCLVAATAAAMPWGTGAAAETTAQNLTTYVPECTRACVEQKIRDSGLCSGPDDSECLCTNISQIGPGSVPCSRDACANEFSNSTEMAAALKSGYLAFCARVWSSPNSPTTGPPSGFPSNFSSLPTSAITPSASSDPSGSGSGDGSAGDNDGSSDSGGGGGVNLSTGAIVGIAVGVGVFVVSITGGLLVFAFRLGRRRPDSDPADPALNSPQHSNGGEVGRGGGEGGGGEGQGAVAVAEAGEEAEEPKPQLSGTPLNELQAEYTVAGFDPLKELETRERPAELSADPPSYTRHDTRNGSGNGDHDDWMGAIARS
ncbi:hypothetical protein GGS23DRAFT_7020 [Durotheca rogersii]|uniref:uncharacterized protein n=1 Tax=Durotheca rogersii TaxID=419775 RepID=UPI00221E62C9|nr:uncharacterized protein GGS23DRAFT_7020 [Durotheca rogersii]KAI5868010.1 hypothetical protein GGS23DRAFT_7020 [Durotheca rogersii]